MRTRRSATLLRDAFAWKYMICSIQPTAHHTSSTPKTEQSAPTHMCAERAKCAGTNIRAPAVPFDSDPIHASPRPRYTVATLEFGTPVDALRIMLRVRRNGCNLVDRVANLLCAIVRADPVRSAPRRAHRPHLQFGPCVNAVPFQPPCPALLAPDAAGARREHAGLYRVATRRNAMQPKHIMLRRKHTVPAPGRPSCCPPTTGACARCSPTQ